MMKPSTHINSLLFSFLAIFLAVLAPARQAFPLEITPFPTFNQSPLVQIFGLPAAEPSAIEPAGHFAVRLSVDLANNFAIDRNGPEEITLDGETYRNTLALRYGVGKGMEIGIDIPVIAESGGILDSSIIAWHDFFSLNQNGRDSEPRGRLLFRYADQGGERLAVNHPNGGIGDLRLLGGIQLYHEGSEAPRTVALRASLKLPTGDSALLHGSGSTDFALWLSAADDYRLRLGHWSLFGGGGAMVMSKGDVLGDKQRRLAAFGTFGTGWSPFWWLAFKTQLNLNTPFYKHSSVKELTGTSIQWVMGQTIAFSPRISLDLGVSEDLLMIATSPDFGINLALRMRF